MPVPTLRALALGALDKHMSNELSRAKERIELLDDIYMHAWYALQLPAYRIGRVTLDMPSNWHWYYSRTAQLSAIHRLNIALKEARMKQIEGKGSRAVVIDRFQAAQNEIRHIQRQWERCVTAVDKLLYRLRIGRTYEDLWFMDDDRTRLIQRPSRNAW